MPTLSAALAIAIAHHQAGRLDLAEEIYRRILAADPDHAEAWYLLGVIGVQVGNNQRALDYLTRAIALRPGDAAYHNRLGEAYQALRCNVEALDCYRRAVELNSDCVGAYNNMGNALRGAGKLTEAADCYRRALQRKPDFADAYTNLGSVLRDLGELDEAVACHRRAIELAPDLAEAHNNLGNARKDQGLLGEAIVCFRRALRLKSHLSHVHGNLIYALHFCADYDAAAIRAETRRWNNQFAEPLRPSIQSHPNDRSSTRRLRIGYVSPDFREHPVGRFLLPLLAGHDHRDFEIFCYFSAQVTDAVTTRCREQADVWRPVAPLSDAELAGLVRQDQIDILVDLTMHMAGSRLRVFARKPAPVQVTYLAYCGTTGLGTIDYRLTDPYLDPPGGDERCYAEQSIRLPETYWCYRPAEEAPPVNALPAREAGRVTFGCLNNLCKVSEPTLAAWCLLLQAVPDSRLLLHAHTGSHRDRLRQFLAERGVAPERLTFVGFLPMAEYTGVYRQMDVALDPFPYGGGTTTCDALWMGVPVVSLAGQTAVGRGGVSILSNVGLPELIARDPAHYVAIAAALAHDPSRLANLRATLRARMQNSPLMDGPRFARNVESAYRAMWRQWCASSPSRDIGSERE